MVGVSIGYIVSIRNEIGLNYFRLNAQEEYYLRLGLQNHLTKFQVLVIHRLYKEVGPVPLAPWLKSQNIPYITGHRHLTKMVQLGLVTKIRKKYYLSRKQKLYGTCILTGTMRLGSMIHHMKEECKEN